MQYYKTVKFSNKNISLTLLFSISFHLKREVLYSLDYLEYNIQIMKSNLWRFSVFITFIKLRVYPSVRDKSRMLLLSLNFEFRNETHLKQKGFQ